MEFILTWSMTIDNEKVEHVIPIHISEYDVAENWYKTLKASNGTVTDVRLSVVIKK